MSMIEIEVRPPDAGLAEQWQALIKRAPANVFLSPAALAAAQETGFAKVHMLLAWHRGMQPARLVGVWALDERRLVPFLPRLLCAPPFDYAFMSSPVVDPAHLDEVAAAFLDAIERHPALPKLVRLKYLDGDDASYAAIARALAASGRAALQFGERSRPYLVGEDGTKRSGATRKKLRQDWNRLSALGAVDILNEGQPDAVRDAFEVFLAMEAESWKGRRGTALLCAEADTAFARRMVWNLAGQQSASVALLRLDGRPIAAQVLLACGAVAYTWKTAFDSDYGKYSPGALLVDKVTQEMLAREGIAAVESCSPEGGFMARMWTGRRTSIDLLADVGARQSLGFAAMAAWERGYGALRSLRDALRALARAPGTHGRRDAVHWRFRRSRSAVLRDVS